jgi:hypothetical protein
VLSAKVSGKVLLYNSRDAEEPLITFRQEVTPDFSTVLQGLSEHYSPIKSKSLGMLLVYLLIVIPQNSTIACMFMRTICGLVKVVSILLSKIGILFSGTQMRQVT